VIIAACLIAVCLAVAAHADIIYFKDGLKMICQERAWEEKDQVKCEYAGWVITYQKKDVLRILKTTPFGQPAKIEKKPQNLANPNLNAHNPDVTPEAEKASGMVF